MDDKEFAAKSMAFYARRFFCASVIAQLSEILKGNPAPHVTIVDVSDEYRNLSLVSVVVNQGHPVNLEAMGVEKTDNTIITTHEIADGDLYVLPSGEKVDLKEAVLISTKELNRVKAEEMAWEKEVGDAARAEAEAKVREEKGCSTVIH